MATQVIEQMSVENFIGQSACIQQLRERIAKLASYDVNLLLQGESGTGKELIARIVHGLSHRRDGPFLGVNCAAIHETLLESELFGHEAGAFTGARHATLGFLRAADGGSILLDEVGDMSEALQRKLLRVLEERAVVPVGGTQAVPIDVRVIAATNLDLAQAVQEGSFRADLYYRLNILCLTIAPLRERRCDISVLAEHMLSRVAADLGLPRKRLSPEASEAMMHYDWPGNVRELGNVIQRAYVLSDRPKIEVQDLSENLRIVLPQQTERFLTLEEEIRKHIKEALDITGGVRNRAAQMLGIDRTTLWRMTHRFNMG